MSTAADQQDNRQETYGAAHQEEEEDNSAPPDPLAEAQKRNARANHTNFSKGGMSIRRRLQRMLDEKVEFDATTFQGLELDEIHRLRQEIHHRCAVSNGTIWKRDVHYARGEGSANAKRSYCEGSELLLNSQVPQKHISTPRIEIDTSIAKRMGDVHITPGPTDYHPRPVSSRINNRWIGFLPNSPPKRLEDDLKKVVPSPQSYYPHRPLGDDRPKWTIRKRPVFCTGGTAENDANYFATPTSYVPPISDFDVDRKMPNGATAARFYVMRAVHHHAPGPLDTAPSSVTNWIFRDRRDKKWKPVGNSNPIQELCPLPPSEVEARKRRQEAYEKKMIEQQHQQKDGDNNNNNNTRKSRSAPAGDQQQQSASSHKRKSDQFLYKHQPALLLLHELHKRGYQHLRLVVEQEKREKETEPPKTDSEEQQPQQPKKKRKTSTVTIFHIASKYSVVNGDFALKDGASKETVVFDVVKTCIGGDLEIPLPPWETSQPPREPSSDEEKAKYEEHCQRYVQENISRAADVFLKKNEALALRAKGRDFTYVSWFEKLLKGGVLPFGDAPLTTGEEKISGAPYTLTLLGNKVTCPPLK